MKYLLIVFLSIFSFSNLYSKELPDSVSAEYFGCKFDEGKDLNDMNKWIAKWNKWMDSSDLNEYEASLLLPLYRSPNDEIDFLWVGRTNSWEELAKGQSAYLTSGLAESNPAKSCPFSFIARQIPSGGAEIQEEMNEDEFVAAYWLCDIKGTSRIEDVYSAQTTRMKNISQGGNLISSRIIIPRQGIPSMLRDTDFVMLYVSPSLKQWGANVDNYQNNLEGIGDDNAADEIFSCNNSTVYVGRTIR